MPTNEDGSETPDQSSDDDATLTAAEQRKKNDRVAGKTWVKPDPNENGPKPRRSL